MMTSAFPDPFGASTFTIRDEWIRHVQIFSTTRPRTEMKRAADGEHVYHSMPTKHSF